VGVVLGDVATPLAAGLRETALGLLVETAA
jgi:hypothetical protein